MRFTTPIELLDPAEMAEADRLTAAIVPTAVLMERAGEAVARAALANGPKRVLILCGPGNNGGDGYVAARYMAQAGVDVTVAALQDPAFLKGDAVAAAAAWSGRVLPLDVADLEPVDLVIDALFGAGLTRDIEGLAHQTIAAVNAWARSPGRRVLSVDVPSGIDGAGGGVRSIAIQATETVTFFRLKPGHILLPGRQHCGRVTLADIGIAPDVLDTIAPLTRLNTPRLWFAALRRPTLTGHKYGRGHAVVVSGPLAQTGAARLAARGALRVGAGLVTMATPADALPVHAAALTAVMTRIVEDAAGLHDLLADPRKNAIVLGPGLGVGARTRDLVLAALTPGEPRSVTLDADALTSFANQPRALFDAIHAGGHAGHVVVLTPHDGEFSKLFGALLDISQSKPQRTRAAAALSGGVVLLKGPDSVVAHPDGRASIAASDAPWLATAGSGDVLAGFITGLLAQGMPSFEATSAAVWMHAEAGRLFGPGLISEDLPDMLPGVLRDLLKEMLGAGNTHEE